MFDEEAVDLDLAARLAAYERIIKAAKTMSAQEKIELEAWEKRHVAGDGELSTSDWPGWHAIVNRISH